MNQENSSFYFLFTKLSMKMKKICSFNSSFDDFFLLLCLLLRHFRLLFMRLNNGRVGELLLQRSIVSCNWITLRLTTAHERVTIESSWACADSKMTFSLTNGAMSTLSSAGVNTLIIDACSVIGTLAISLAFAANT